MTTATLQKLRGFVFLVGSILLSFSAATLAADVSPAPAVQEQLTPRLVLRVIGRDVKGPTGVVVAQIVNVLVDEEGKPQAAVLDYGGFLGVGRRRIAVAWRAFRFGGEEIALSLGRDQLKNFPEHKDGETIIVAVPPPASAPRTD